MSPRRMLNPARDVVSSQNSTLDATKWQRAAAAAGDEARVLELIASRLRIGRKCYGRLDIIHDRRDWPAEALEELLDASVYLAAALLRASKRSGRPEHRPRRRSPRSTKRGRP